MAHACSFLINLRSLEARWQPSRKSHPNYNQTFSKRKNKVDARTIIRWVTSEVATRPSWIFRDWNASICAWRLWMYPAWSKCLHPGPNWLNISAWRRMTSMRDNRSLTPRITATLACSTNRIDSKSALPRLTTFRGMRAQCRWNRRSIGLKTRVLLYKSISTARPWWWVERWASGEIKSTEMNVLIPTTTTYKPPTYPLFL